MESEVRRTPASRRRCVAPDRPSPAEPGLRRTHPRAEGPGAYRVNFDGTVVCLDGPVDAIITLQSYKRDILSRFRHVVVR